LGSPDRRRVGTERSKVIKGEVSLRRGSSPQVILAAASRRGEGGWLALKIGLLFEGRNPAHPPAGGTEGETHP